MTDVNVNNKRDLITKICNIVEFCH